ncbi:hypothetical protein LTR62_007726 [Meristemomyces frigidus]|uniref:Uncharacterized protein n=1 Tax=Meristemomyces frigidus TaxID=1508187 RepID=A0AAN7TAK0_9PEZI|nr:hypothetical protein LTR62_007726 [Meristemomyces frigidus]
MAPKVPYIQLMLICQSITCCYGAYQSYGAITNLRKYEETSKKLAEWSNTAAEHLRRTRTTQGAGAIAILLSLVSSVFLTTDFTYQFLNPAGWLRFSISPLMLGTVLFARHHIKNYWNPNDNETVGTRIPLPNMEGYNEAQRRTEELLTTLQWLEYGWVTTTLFAGLATRTA